MNIVPIESARPELWCILVNENFAESISCVFDDKSQAWSGVVRTSSIVRLSALLEKAKHAMKIARTQNREVWI